MPDAGEITIQRLIEIFPVTFPQRDTNIEHQNSLNSCLQAIIKQAFYILPGIVNKRKNRCHPHKSRYSQFFTSHQHFKTLSRSRHIRFKLPAQLLIISSERHLHDCLGLLIDRLQQIEIPKHQIGFCEYRNAIFIPVDQFQTLPGQLKLFFSGKIRIAHGTCTDHTLVPPGTKRPFQQFRSIFLDLDIFKSMCKAVALTATVAIDAAVRASAVNIHSVILRQNPLCLYKMHGR